MAKSRFTTRQNSLPLIMNTPKLNACVNKLVTTDEREDDEADNVSVKEVKLTTNDAPPLAADASTCKTEALANDDMRITENPWETK